MRATDSLKLKKQAADLLINDLAARIEQTINSYENLQTDLDAFEAGLNEVAKRLTKSINDLQPIAFNPTAPGYDQEKTDAQFRQRTTLQARRGEIEEALRELASARWQLGRVRKEVLTPTARALEGNNPLVRNALESYARTLDLCAELGITAIVEPRTGSASAEDEQRSRGEHVVTSSATGTEVLPRKF